MKTIIKIALFSLILTGCSIIDHGKIPIETNTKGFETAGIRVGSITTKYQEVKPVVAKDSVIVKEYTAIVKILVYSILVLIIITIVFFFIL